MPRTPGICPQTPLTTQQPEGRAPPGVSPTPPVAMGCGQGHGHGIGARASGHMRPGDLVASLGGAGFLPSGHFRGKAAPGLEHGLVTARQRGPFVCGLNRFPCNYI